MMPKVSCIMPTYGRFHTVERSISLFLQQDYPNKELIIVNTAPMPLNFGADLSRRPELRMFWIRFDMVRFNLYENTGSIRRDGLKLATGDLYIGWDDDDLWAPFHISQAVKGFQEAQGKDEKIIAWKPKYSLYTGDGGKTYRKEQNHMEASIITDIKNVFFTETTGPEMVAWLESVRANGQLAVSDVRPSYCYFWGDGLHKQSGDIRNPKNFENHKAAEQDFGDRPLELVDVSKFNGIWK